MTESLSPHSSTPERSFARGRLAWTARLFPRLLYALASVGFTSLYYQTTVPWTSDGFAACAEGTGPDAVYRTLFGTRILVPLVARILRAMTGADYRWIFMALTAAAVFGIITAYRAYLSNFLRRPFAAVLSVAIVYPMIWNYCLLNKLYYPFDMPSVLFLVLGSHFVYRRNWRAYYPTLLLAALNRDASCVLVLVFIAGLWGQIPGKRLARHVLGQVALCAAVLAVLGLSLRIGAPRSIAANLQANVTTLGNMLALRGDGLRDWVKLLFAFGGSWLAVPWVLRGQPGFVKRALLVVIPFVAVVSFTAVIDEVRQYGDLIPIVTTPLVYALGRALGGERKP